MNIIWQTENGDATNFELEYLTNIIFKNLTYNSYFDNKQYQTVLDDSIIVYSYDHSNITNEFKTYIEKFTNNNYKFYLVHLSNENLQHQTEYYRFAKKVYRNYFDSNISQNNVIHIPLGFKSGFYNSNIKKTTNNKTYDFCFIGQPKTDRFELLNICDNYNTFKHLTTRWNCHTSLSIDICKSVYKSTKFAPCPMGFVHPDSFRFMECLESGCIPIIKSYNGFDYHTKIWGKTPIPKIESWNELSNFAKLNEDDYNKIYNDVFDWYENYKNNILTNIIPSSI